MTHTLPDYTSKYRLANIFSGIDVFESAARLGSINTYDRRGNVIFMDDFEATVIKPLITDGGAGAANALTTDYCRNNNQSLKVTCGAGADNATSIWYYLPYQRSSKIGFEYHFSFEDGIKRVNIALNVYDGVTRYYFYCQLRITDNSIYYLNSAWGDTLLDNDVDFYQNVRCFHDLKLIVDWRNKKFVSLLFDDKEYNMTNISGATIGDGTDPNLAPYISIWNNAAGNPNIYFDDVILTQNEP